jgi:hypothetical protein
LPDYHLLRPNVAVVPFRVVDAISESAHKQPSFFQENEGANISSQVVLYLKALGYDDVESVIEFGDLIWLHVTAISTSREYLTENRDGVRHDWPRIPLPGSKELLERSAALGRQVADLLDPEQPVEGVTTGVIRQELRVIANVQTVGDGTLDLSTDLELTAGWGYRGQRGVVMPGGGKTEQRPYTADEREAIIAGAEALGLDPDEAFTRIGQETVDVFLNDLAYWQNIPVNVWTYTIGGYQVIKKWLSYRESRVLGRHLRREEVREVQNIARRITALLLLEPELDANYQAVKASVYPWPKQQENDMVAWTE